MYWVHTSMYLNRQNHSEDTLFLLLTMGKDHDNLNVCQCRSTGQVCGGVQSSSLKTKQCQTSWQSYMSKYLYILSTYQYIPVCTIFCITYQYSMYRYILVHTGHWYDGMYPGSDKKPWFRHDSRCGTGRRAVITCPIHGFHDANGNLERHSLLTSAKWAVHI